LTFTLTEQSLKNSSSVCEVGLFTQLKFAYDKKKNKFCRVFSIQWLEKANMRFLKTWYISSTALLASWLFQTYTSQTQREKTHGLTGIRTQPPRLRAQHRHTKLPGCPIFAVVCLMDARNSFSCVICSSKSCMIHG
jgi:hypothetical protein